MATSDLVTQAYLAIYRSPISAAQATATGAAIDAGTTTLTATINSYIAANIETTSPAIAELAYVDGVTPTSAKITTLATTFEPAQLAAYTAAGVANPALGPYEATGRAIAQTDPNFVAIGGATVTDSAFITTNYIKIFGINPSTGAASNFQSQITYFENLFTANGETTTEAQLEARGAVLGQMIGYAFTGGAPAGSTPSLPAQVAAFETGLANGTATYGTPLPVVTPAGNVGVTINLLGAADFVSPTAANPAFKSTANNDLILGTLNVSSSIDAGGGTDTLQVKLATNIATSGGGTADTIANTEIFQINGNSFAIDVTGVTGATDYGSFKETGSTTFNNISSAFIGKLEVNTDSGSATTFQFATTAPTADLTLTSNAGGLVSVGASTGTGATSLAIHAATNTTDAFDLWDTTTATVDGGGNFAFTIANGNAPMLTSLNMSAATGTESLTFDPTKSVAITLNNGTGSDVFSSPLTTAVLTTLNLGTGPETTVETAAPTNLTFTAGGALKTGLVEVGFVHGTDHVDIHGLANFVATTATVQGNASAAATLQAAVAIEDTFITTGHSTVFTYATSGTTDTYVLNHAATDGIVKLAGLASYTTGTAAAGTADVFTS